MSRPKRLVRQLKIGAIKAAYTIGGRVTPHLAANLAAKLWCRLPRNAGRRQDNRPQPGRTEQVTMPGGRRLAVEIWGPNEAALVYLVHGWGGWRGQLGAFIAPLVEAGYRVVGFDTVSHGESDPGPHGPHHSSGGEMIESFTAVAAVYGSAQGIIAHSLGCATALRTIIEGNVTTQRLCLVAPSPDMEETARRFGQTLGLPPRTIGLMLRSMAAWAHRQMEDFDLAAMATNAALPPALVIHDELDRESRYRTAVEIVEAWPNARLMTTHGYGHHRILIAPEVVTAVMANIIHPTTDMPQLGQPNHDPNQGEDHHRPPNKPSQGA